jgi:hypothetical protein
LKQQSTYIMKMKPKTKEYNIFLRKPHSIQKQIRDSTAKRKVIRAGRRGGKTVIAATICVDKFLHGFRPLYAAPSAGQLDTWWFEVKRALAELTDAGVYKKNETEHTIERVGTHGLLTCYVVTIVISLYLTNSN